MNDQPAQADTRRRILLAVYDEDGAAQTALERLSDHDFPMDRVSLAGRSGSPGDDPTSDR